MSLAFVTKWLIYFLITYLILVAAMFFLQRYILFHPTSYPGTPQGNGLNNFSEVQIQTEDGLQITGWFHKSSASKKAILFFYGNADRLSNYPTFFKSLADAGYSVLGINYRGYAGTRGTPSEEGLYLDGKAAFKFLQQYTKSKNIIVVGRSLGSGVATELATEHEIGGLVLISPYTSMIDIASEVYWYLPIKYISRYKFDNLRKLPTVKAPVLIIHGDQDMLIPQTHSLKLLAAVNSRKELIVYQGGGHDDLDNLILANYIIGFFSTK